MLIYLLYSLLGIRIWEWFNLCVLFLWVDIDVGILPTLLVCYRNYELIHPQGKPRAVRELLLLGHRKRLIEHKSSKAGMCSDSFILKKDPVCVCERVGGGRGRERALCKSSDKSLMTLVRGNLA